MRIAAFFLLIITLSSCWKWRIPSGYPNANNKVYGNKVIYMPVGAARQIAYSASPVAVINPGKIYIKGNYIYQTEQGKGIHIIDNTNPANAARIGFISIYGCTEISILGNFLYSNNLDDLVVIDIRNLKNVSVVKRVTHTFPGGLYDYYQAKNPPSPGYYECPNSDSGVVAGWRKDSIKTYCYY